MLGCTHCHPPLNYTNFSVQHLGVDETNGRFADVTLETCSHCRTLWLAYEVAYEDTPRSGRWYRAPITTREATAVTPQNAVEFMEKCSEYLYGGSYFSSTGATGHGRLSIDQ